MSESIQVEARYHSGDIRAEVGRDGVTLTMHGDEEHAYADFDWSAALTLGAWLVQQARTHRAARQTTDGDRGAFRAEGSSAADGETQDR